MFKILDKFFDRLEDNVRNHLSHYPIVYAFIAGVGIVLFWRGIWHTADLFEFMTGPVSTVVGVIILLMVGLFVSFFIGDSIIIAGIRREKKLVERTETEIETEKEELDEVRDMVKTVENEVDEIKELIKKSR